MKGLADTRYVFFVSWCFSLVLCNGGKLKYFFPYRIANRFIFFSLLADGVKAGLKRLVFLTRKVG